MEEQSQSLFPTAEEITITHAVLKHYAEKDDDANVRYALNSISGKLRVVTGTQCRLDAQEPFIMKNEDAESSC